MYKGLDRFDKPDRIQLIPSQLKPLGGLDYQLAQTLFSAQGW
jgi:hypothetical protein